MPTAKGTQTESSLLAAIAAQFDDVEVAIRKHSIPLEYFEVAITVNPDAASPGPTAKASAMTRRQALLIAKSSLPASQKPARAARGPNKPKTAPPEEAAVSGAPAPVSDDAVALTPVAPRGAEVVSPLRQPETVVEMTEEEFEQAKSGVYPDTSILDQSEDGS